MTSARIVAGVAGLALVALALVACPIEPADVVVSPPPRAPAAPIVASPAPLPAPLPDGEQMDDDDPSPPWPRFPVRRVPADAVMPLAESTRVVTFDIAPDGAGMAVVATRDEAATADKPAATTTSLWWWDFTNPTVAVEGEALRLHFAGGRGEAEDGPAGL